MGGRSSKFSQSTCARRRPYRTTGLILQPWSSDPSTYPGCDSGINPWYASEVDRFKQYAWFEGLSKWEEQGEIVGTNGRAGCGCYSWGKGTVDYTMMLGSAKTLGVFWRDSNASSVSTSEHPINSWTNGKLSGLHLRHIQCYRRILVLTYTVTDMAINNIHTHHRQSLIPNSSMHKWPTTQSGTFNVSFDAENNTFSNEVGATVKDPSGKNEHPRYLFCYYFYARRSWPGGALDVVPDSGK